MNHRFVLLLAFVASPLLAETIDNCASLLGSISVELRYARKLPASEKTTFICPRERETRPLVGASKQRILNALGPPDASGTDASANPSWSYYFTGKTSGDRGTGFPELVFSFDGKQEVAAVDCHMVR